MNIQPMMPHFLQETFLNTCIIIGAIVAAVGVFCLIFTRLSAGEPLLVMALGAAILFGLRKVKSINTDFEMSGSDDESEGAP